MSRFPAPENALTHNDVETLINSGTIWSVIGSVVNPYKSEHYVMSADKVDDNGNTFIEVQNVYHNDNGTVTRFESSMYLGDRNMGEHGSSNDNYLFLNEEDADNAVEYLKKCWDENPEMKEEKELSDKNLWASLDDWMEDWTEDFDGFDED